MNSIEIHGRLTKDPELKTTNSGVEVCNFTVAVDRPHTKKEDRKADYFNCVAWRGAAPFVEKYFHKGDGIMIDGYMINDRYEDKETGKNRDSWKLHVEKIEFPMGRNSGSSSNSEPQFEELPPDEGTLPF